MPGQYTFVFSNIKDKLNVKSVTLAIHPGYDTEKLEEEEKELSTEQENRAMAEAAGVDIVQIQSLNSAVRKVYKSCKNLQAESKMSMIRQDSHN